MPTDRGAADRNSDPLGDRGPARAWHRGARALAVALVLALGTVGPAVAAEDPVDVAARADVTFATRQLAATVSRYSVKTYPFYTLPDGRWLTTKPSSWTSGFMPGALWLAYQATGDPVWKTRAIASQAGVRVQAASTKSMDVGFQVLDSFGNGHRLAGTDDFRQVTLQAAASLATRYDDGLGLVRSWNSPASAPPDDFRVIVDGLMNLELLFWAAGHGGDPAYRTMALRHALRTRQDHLRPDGSTFQLVIYDSDADTVKLKTTAPGYAPTSTWARGQAWAVRGFSIAYRETGDARLLDAAERTADLYLSRLPPDLVPPWDFDAPEPAPKDSSAAAIAASGLLELARLEPDAARSARYLDAGRRILLVLSGPAYRAAGTTNAAVLLHGTYDFRHQIQDTGTIWADYFLLEALMNLRRLPPSTPALPIAAVRANTAYGTDTAAKAVDGDLSTRWSANGTASWLRVDLGRAQPIKKVTLAYALGDERASRLSLQTSPNGSAWTTRANAMTSGATLRPETYDLPDVTARYVRVIGRGSSLDTWNRISEFTVH